MIAFPSGSNCHLRGQGLYHHIGSYQGVRHSLILTNKQSVRLTAPIFDEKLLEFSGRYEDLKASGTQPTSVEDKALMQAGNQGQDAILEMIWSKAQVDRKKKRADRDKSRTEKDVERKEDAEDDEAEVVGKKDKRSALEDGEGGLKKRQKMAA